jgi:hypothetical protein
VALIPASELAGLLETAQLRRSKAGSVKPKDAKVLRKEMPGEAKGQAGSHLSARACSGFVLLGQEREVSRFEVPFEGLGKSEPLKHLLSGCWSRRVTQEHRMA